MDRRGFLKGLCGLTGLAGLATIIGLGGMAGLTPDRRRFDPLTATLDEQLADLADPQFAAYAKGQELQTLWTTLTDQGVISTSDGIKHEKILTLAQQESPKLYQGFYYTPAELDLYALAYLAHQPQNAGQARSGSGLSHGREPRGRLP